MDLFINVPVGLLGMWAVARFVPPLRQPDPGPFDTKGFALAVLAITALMGAARRWASAWCRGPCKVGHHGLALGALAAYVRHALRTPRPVLDLRLLRVDTFRRQHDGRRPRPHGPGRDAVPAAASVPGGPGLEPLEAGLVTIGTGWGLRVQAGGARAHPARGLPPDAHRLQPAHRRADGRARLLPGRRRPSRSSSCTLMFSGFMRSMQFTATNTVASRTSPER